MFIIQSTFPQFADLTGAPLENGSIYFGVVNLNPVTNPIVMYWDSAGTIPAVQPLQTINGLIVRDGTPANVYCASAYSIAVYDHTSALVYTLPSVGLFSNSLTSINYQSQIAAQAATIDTATNYITVAGYATPGDGGNASYVSIPDIGVLQTYQFRSNSNTRRWQIYAPEGLKPQSLFTVGTTDDSAAVLATDLAAAALGFDVRIQANFNIGSTITFSSHVIFTSQGRFTMAATTKVNFSKGFEAGSENAYIFNFTAANSGIGARVTAKEITPYMFGGVGNSPSTDEAAALTRAFNAASASGIPLNLTPTKWTAKSQIVWDYGTVGEYVGVKIFGQGTRSEIAFDNSIAYPNLKITDLTGTFIAGPNQYAVFYGDYRDFQVSGLIGGGPVLQFGEAALNGAGNAQVYFNGVKLQNLVVKNNIVNGGGVGVLLSGMTGCDIDITSNAGGVFYDGSVAFDVRVCNFCNWHGSGGNAEVGIKLNLGSIYGNNFSAFDLEVLKVGWQSRSQFAANNKYSGTFASMDYCVDFQSNSGGNIVDGAQSGGIGVSFIRNYAATDATYGGYGITFRQPNTNMVGYRYPTMVSPDYPTSITPGIWYRNTYGQDAQVSVFSSVAISGLDVRPWFDTAGTGVRIANSGQTQNFLLKAGESFLVTGGGTVTSSWRGG